MRTHIALYGSTKLKRGYWLKRGYCQNCQTWAIIIENRILCCDESIESEKMSKRYKRMAEGALKRKRPKDSVIKAMLSLQNNRCFYCGIPFGTPYLHPKQKKIRLTRLCLDHLVPFKYSQNNKEINFVCSCNICNSIKYDLVFQTVEEACDYVRYRRKKIGYEEAFNDSLPRV